MHVETSSDYFLKVLVLQKYKKHKNLMSATDCYIFDVFYRKYLQNKTLEKKAKINTDLGLICLIIYVDENKKRMFYWKKSKK